MDKSWAISGVDLHLDLSGNRVRAGLEAALREAVQTGRLVPGTRLPSTRALAADLGIARNTVAEAYSQLTAEGWLTAQQGSGTRVAVTAEVPVASEATTGASSQTRQSRYDLRPGSRVAVRHAQGPIGRAHHGAGLWRPSRPARAAQGARGLPVPSPGGAGRAGSDRGLYWVHSGPRAAEPGAARLRGHQDRGGGIRACWPCPVAFRLRPCSCHA